MGYFENVDSPPQQGKIQIHQQQQQQQRVAEYSVPAGSGGSGIPPKPQRPQSARVAGKNATVTVPLVATEVGRGGAKRSSGSGAGDAHINVFYQPQIYHRSVTGTPHQQQGVAVYNSQRSFTPKAPSNTQHNPATPHSRAVVHGHHPHMDSGGDGRKLSSHPSSAQLRWSEKRSSVKTSMEVMKEVAVAIREQEAKSLLQMAASKGGGEFKRSASVNAMSGAHQYTSSSYTGGAGNDEAGGPSGCSGSPHPLLRGDEGGGDEGRHPPAAAVKVYHGVKVCDQPGSGKFNTVFHLKRNLDLQLEGHRTLMNTRFSAEEDRLPIAEQSSIAVAGGGRPLSARSRGTDANSVRAPSTTAAAAAAISKQSTHQVGPSKPAVRPSSAKSTRSSVRTTAVSAFGGTTVGGASSSGGIGKGGDRLGPSGTSAGDGEFKTFWHVETNAQLRTSAMQDLSLGIHKEPFVPTADRVLFRRSKEEARHPFENAELAAETANRARPATPRSVLQFFNMNDADAAYVDVDHNHNTEWRNRVLAKIAQVDRKNRKKGMGSQLQKSSSGIRNIAGSGSPRDASSARQIKPQSGAGAVGYVPNPNQPQFVVRSQATTSRQIPQGQLGSSSPGNKKTRKPLMGNKLLSPQQAQRGGLAAEDGSPKMAAQRRTREVNSGGEAVVDPRDVYAWNAHVVIPEASRRK